MRVFHRFSPPLLNISIVIPSLFFLRERESFLYFHRTKIISILPFSLSKISGTLKPTDETVQLASDNLETPQSLHYGGKVRWAETETNNTMKKDLETHYEQKCITSDSLVYISNTCDINY